MESEPQESCFIGCVCVCAVYVIMCIVCMWLCVYCVCGICGVCVCMHMYVWKAEFVVGISST